MATPELSIVIPVFREQLAIRSCLAYLATCPDMGQCEIIVVDGDDGSTGTPEDLIPVRVVDSPAGRGRQLNAGARVAEAPALLFLHVDTLPPRDFVKRILTALEHHVAGAFDLQIATRHPVTVVISLVGRIRSRLTRIPYGDQAHFIRRDLFEKIGGFPDEPIMEDVALMDKLKAAGHKITFLRPAARTSDRRWRSEGRIRGTIRNWRLMVDYRRGVPPSELIRRYSPSPGSPDVDRRQAGLPGGCRVILFYRTLRQGEVKTRLAAELGPVEALAVYRAMLEDSVAALVPISRSVLPYADEPGAGQDPLSSIEDPRWKGAKPRQQRGRSLEERMENALKDAFDGGAKTALLVGSDIPGLDSRRIAEAAAMLRTHDAVIGKSVSRGYYLIGFRREAYRPLLSGTGTAPDPADAVIEALNSHGLSVGRVQPMRDVDTTEDLKLLVRSKQGDHPALDRELDRLMPDLS